MNKKSTLIAAVLAVVMGTFLPMLGSGLALWEVPSANAVAPYFSKPAFQKVWLTTDLLVDNGTTRRSFLWGPTLIDANYELYENAAPLGGERRWVQYFDKSRMEINNPYGNPDSQFYVSNGLLVVELVSGRRQEGDSTFFNTGNPANNVPVAGDPISINAAAPTYRTLKAVASYDDTTNTNNRKPNRAGERVTETLTKLANGDGQLGNDPSKNYPNTNYVYYVNELGHNIPGVFWDYMNQSGPVFDPASRTVVNGKVFDWLYAMGFPVTEAYWTRVKVAGVEKDVMMQCFQRRCLTYTPANDPAYQVEMGNVGQHYFGWRYGVNGRMPNSQLVNAPTFQPLKLPALSYGLNSFYFYQDREQVTGWVKDLGARWVRQQIAWKDIEIATRTDPNRFVWDELDKVVDHLYVNNVRLLLTVVKSPKEYSNGTEGLPLQTKLNKFSEFMFAMAKRYRGKVDAYEIWNEQNYAKETGPGVNFRNYLNLLQKGYNAVKEADPNAIVVFGSLTPTETNNPNIAIPDTTFLKNIYAYNKGEVKNYFDVLGVHPGGQVNPPELRSPQGPGPGYNNSNEFYFRRVEDLRKIMEQAGDGKKQIWLTEFGWSSDTNPQTGYEYAKANDETEQAQYIKGAYQYALRNYPWMGAMILWNLNFALPSVVPNSPLADGKNDEKIGFSILRRDGSKRPSYFAFQEMARAAK